MEVEYYLAKGFEREFAEYFACGRKRIVGVSPNNNYTLTLEFEGGERRLYDCNFFFEGDTVFKPFTDYENFKRVYLDKAGCICWDKDPLIDSDEVWSNKVDLCPDSCYVYSTPLE